MLNKPGLSATSGEKSFYYRIEHISSLRDDIIGYTEPAIGGHRPDFLLLSPKFGVLIVEIKDYLAEFLKTIQRTGDWEHFKGESITRIRNPFDQIYQYRRDIQDRVNYCKIPSQIKVPVIQLVCFSQISKEDPIGEDIRKLCPTTIYVCFKEALTRNKAFGGFFTDLLPTNIQLSKEHFEILRGNIVPSSRLPTREQAKLDKYFTAEQRIKLLDQEQEKLARELGAGHRLIFGVAGSGKTVILIARARFLAKKNPDWKILILCYNKLLRDSLYQLIIPQDYEADITVNTFHGWARSYILSVNNEFSRLYIEGERKAKREDKLTEFFHDFVPSLFLNFLKDLGEDKVVYDSILIDEAQDFEQDWFKPIIEVLNPESNSLLLTCDGLQGIYARKRFTWKSVGIQAVGRVKKFAKSYRTPIEIGNLAQKALPTTLRDLLDKFDEFISTKEYAGDHGTVEVIESDSRNDECKKLAEKIARMLKKPQEILILFRYNMAKWNYEHPIFKFLKDLNIEWQNLEKYNYDLPGLLISTIHSSKGLECDTIIIPEVNKYNSNQDRQLLYVGITRSRKKLILSAHKSTLLLDAFKKSLEIDNNPSLKLIE
jgi:superfamily I DNA and RNA helicase